MPQELTNIRVMLGLGYIIVAFGYIELVLGFYTSWQQLWGVRADTYRNAQEKTAL